MGQSPQNFIHQSIPIRSPYVEDIWRVTCLDDGEFLMCADASWDIIIAMHNGHTQIYADGPTSHARKLHYKPGMQLTGIRFKIGVNLQGLDLRSIVNGTFAFTQRNDTFRLGNDSIQIPTAENAEVFIDKLVQKRLLTYDKAIPGMLQETSMPVSRSGQRRFLYSTGLSQMQIRQIQRAWQAMKLLQDGQSAVQVSAELGYTDQPHMTKFLKKLLGQTPRRIDEIVHS